MTDDFTSRVTVDIDGDIRGFEMVAIRTYHNLSREVETVDIHVSSSGTGLHLIGYTDRDLSKEERITLRRALNDDRARIAFDIGRAVQGLPIGVLWDEKTQAFGKGMAPRVGTKDRDFSNIHDALDHITRTNRDPYERVQSLAEKGHKGAPELARKARGETHA